MKVRLKDAVMIDCISYTFVSALLSLLSFSPRMMGEVNKIFNLQLFLCTSLIATGIYIIAKFVTESEILFNLLNFVCIIAVILGLGGFVFKWFPMKLEYILEVCLVCLLAFVVTNLIVAWQYKSDDKKINRILSENNKNE